MAYGLSDLISTIRFGTVKQTKPGFAQIHLPDLDGLRTLWLPVILPKTLKDRACWTLDVGEHVAVLLDALGEDGVVLGAVYSNAEPPPTTQAGTFMVQFSDGAKLEYDRDSHTLTATGMQQALVEAKGDVSVKAGGNIQLKAAGKVMVDAPETIFTGNVIVQKQLAYQGGLAGSGGAGGASAVIKGNVRVEGGDLEVSGKKFLPHMHPDTHGGSTGPVS
ncbi:phage baseplate assembly protein V [Chitinivorax tropicus]|uniref:Phage baseplate assembly protein V n=1 Tax=Chitinivorax tropicus TaxID=714531 RepID=A0A840ML35_9PROT|nr:phage baseplate assembly protein V [Chitinivorax tropicus]MBB5017422.1 phage baseplate assembly protein V [Chitinivorax tropicus]